MLNYFTFYGINNLSWNDRFKNTLYGIHLLSPMMHSTWLCMNYGCGIMLSSTEAVVLTVNLVA
jgi:hypothetical protein